MIKMEFLNARRYTARSYLGTINTEQIREEERINGLSRTQKNSDA
jgi:hypothetical protein